MTTQNIEINERGWKNLATVGEITFTQNQTYTIAARSGGVCEIAIAETQPAGDFIGHIAKADENFTFQYTGEDIWVKCSNNAVIVIS